jgi:phytoene/squalene synthetase
MDANIGPVGQRRTTAATDRQAHEMKVQQANSGGDPLLSALKAVEKRLEAIQQNTDGMAKGKSEPLRRQ